MMYLASDNSPPLPSGESAFSEDRALLKSRKVCLLYVALDSATLHIPRPALCSGVYSAVRPRWCPNCPLSSCSPGVLALPSVGGGHPLARVAADGTKFAPARECRAVDELKSHLPTVRRRGAPMRHDRHAARGAAPAHCLHVDAEKVRVRRLGTGVRLHSWHHKPRQSQAVDRGEPHRVTHRRLANQCAASAEPRGKLV